MAYNSDSAMQSTASLLRQGSAYQRSQISLLTNLDRAEHSNVSIPLRAVIDPAGEPEPYRNYDAEKAVVTQSKPAGPPPGAFNPADNPDGGLQAWLVVLGGWCCLFVSFGWINCIGVFMEYYQTHQLKEYDSSTVAWIPSLETFCMFFFGPFIGFIYDSYGPRYILLAGTFFHVFGLLMTSISTEYYQILLAQGICSAAGASMCFYPAMSVLPTWFFRRRAAAFGLMAAGSSTGGVIFPVMVSHLIPRIGFGWTMRVCAFLILFVMIIANLTLKSRMPPHPKKFNIYDFLKPLTEVPYCLVTVGAFFFFFGMFLPINYIILEASALGMSTRMAGYLIPILSGASLFGRVLPGIVADKVGRFNVMIILNYFTGIVVLALWMPAAANTPIIVFAVLYGFGSGAFVSLAPAVVAQISDVREIGVRNGTMFAIISLAALCSNPIGGAILDSESGKYTGLQVFCGVMCLAGATGFLGARFVLAGPKIVVKV